MLRNVLIKFLNFVICTISVESFNRDLLGNRITLFDVFGILNIWFPIFMIYILNVLKVAFILIIRLYVCFGTFLGTFWLILSQNLNVWAHICILSCLNYLFVFPYDFYKINKRNSSNIPWLRGRFLTFLRFKELNFLFWRKFWNTVSRDWHSNRCQLLFNKAFLPLKIALITPILGSFVICGHL